MIIKTLATTGVLLFALTVPTPGASAAPDVDVSTPVSGTVLAALETPKPKKKCKDRVVKWIKAAGFKNAKVPVVWAIAQRESNGNPNESTWPDLGIVQLNAPSWQGSKYWPDNIYDPVQSFIAMRKMIRDMGFAPWGMSVKRGVVTYDYSQYSMWSEWQRYNWIVYPFEKYYRQFPKACR